MLQSIFGSQPRKKEESQNTQSKDIEEQYNKILKCLKTPKEYIFLKGIVEEYKNTNDFFKKSNPEFAKKEIEVFECVTSVLTGYFLKVNLNTFRVHEKYFLSFIQNNEDGGKHNPVSNRAKQILFHIAFIYYYSSDNNELKRIFDNLDYENSFKDCEYEIDIYLLKGFSLLREQQFEEARAFLKTAILLFKIKSKDHLKKLENALVLVEGILAYYLCEHDKAKENLTCFCNAVINEVINSVNIPLANFFLILIQEEKSPRNSDFIDLLEKFKKDNEENSNNLIVGGCLAIVNSILKKYSIAGSLIDKLGNENFENYYVWLVRSQVEYRAGNYQFAISYAERAYDLNPNCVESFFYQGKSYEALG